MGRRSVLVVLVFVACRSEPDDDRTGYRGGSRLHAEFYQADGDVRVFRQFVDTVHDLSCYFTDAGDGRVRCLPVLTISGFADAACSQLVVVAGCDVPLYVSELPSPVLEDECAPRRTRVHEVGAPVDADALYDFDDSGGCVVERHLEPGEVAYAIGAPASPELFVPGVIDFEPRGEEFEVGVVISEDGARAPWRRRDARRAESCRIEEFPVGSGDLFCLPWRRASAYSFLTYFSDPECRHLVAFGDGTDCGTPKIGFAYHYDLENPSSDVEITLFEPGDAIPADSLYDFWSEPPCQLAGQEVIDAGPYYGIGPTIEAAEFPRLTRTLEGTGRLQSYRYESADAAVVARRSQPLFDAVLETDCYIRRFLPVDGTDNLRCIPTTAVVVLDSDPILYADSACTTRILESESQDNLVIRYGPSTCPYVAEELTTLGPQHDGTVYSRDATGACAASFVALSSPYYLVNSPGLDPNTFAQVAIRE